MHRTRQPSWLSAKDIPAVSVAALRFAAQPRRRQLVSSAWMTSAWRIASRKRSHGSARMALIRMIVASTAPVEDLDLEHLAHDLCDLAAREAKHAGQRRDVRLELRPKRRARHARRQPHQHKLAAARVAQPQQPVLADQRTDRGQLPLLLDHRVAHALLASIKVMPAARERLAFSLANARRCWRVIGGSEDGGRELLRESWDSRRSSSSIRSRNAAISTRSSTFSTSSSVSRSDPATLHKYAVDAQSPQTL